MVQKNKIKSASGNGIDITNTGASAGPAPPKNVVVRKNKVEHAQLSGIEVSATGDGEYQVLANRSLTNASSASTSPSAPTAAPSPATPPSATRGRLQG